MPHPTLTLQIRSKRKKKPLRATAVQRSVSNYMDTHGETHQRQEQMP